MRTIRLASIGLAGTAAITLASLAQTGSCSGVYV